MMSPEIFQWARVKGRVGDPVRASYSLKIHYTYVLKIHNSKRPNKHQPPKIVRSRSDKNFKFKLLINWLKSLCEAQRMLQKNISHPTFKSDFHKTNYVNFNLL